jgi:hypothetical protein
VFTARSGRIDSSGEQSELVLTDVLATKFPGAAEKDRTDVRPHKWEEVPDKSLMWSSASISCDFH